jgi:hypothetical protein
MVRAVFLRARGPGLWLLLSASALGGCDDLSEFRGSFDGSIVEGGFVRECFASDTKATLAFDPERAVFHPPAGLPDAELNRLTTSDGTFQNTVLEPIAALPHDPLSQMDFPGARRLRNFMLVARPTTGPLKGRDAMVVVSLLADERIELRIIARSEETLEPCAAEEVSSDAGSSESGPRVREYFGIFRLKS